MSVDTETAFGRTELEVGLGRPSLEDALVEERSPVGGARSAVVRGGSVGGAQVDRRGRGDDWSAAAHFGGAKTSPRARGEAQSIVRHTVAPATVRRGTGAGPGERRPVATGGGGGGGGGPRGGTGVTGALVEKDLKAIERDFAEGLTSVQVVDIFTRRGIRFSEATFRKYVQQGLLPRSRRVGRKGKHQGSLGLYPATTVRRITVIKKLQAEGHTIEDIQRRFLRYRDEIEVLERGLGTLLESFDEELRAPHFDAGVRTSFKKDLTEAKEHALELLRLLEAIEKRVVGQTERAPGTAAPGGAEDLL